MKEKTKFLKGFTLAEILVSAVILSLIIAGIFAILSVANISWYTDMGLLGLQQQARQAMYKMVREIRQSSPLRKTIDGGKITFYIPPEVYADADGNLNPWVGPISYYRDVNDTNNDGVVNQIIREYPPGTKKIVANDIDSLSFCCWDGVDCCNPILEDCSNLYVLQIQLRATRTVRQKPLVFSLTEKVRLRND